jgi:hypothetical protein
MTSAFFSGQFRNGAEPAATSSAPASTTTATPSMPSVPQALQLYDLGLAVVPAVQKDENGEIQSNDSGRISVRRCAGNEGAFGRQNVVRQ